MKRHLMIIPVVSALFAIFASSAFPAEKYMLEQGVIDVRTNLGDGRYSLSQISDTARKSDLRIVIPTDGLLNRWEYGLWPLRNIIKKAVETPSVIKFGIKEYLEQIRSVQMDNPDMIFVSSVEVSPYYYWFGSPFGSNFIIKDWHRHLLVIGLDSVNDYKNIPVVGNALALAKPFGLSDTLYLLLLLLILAGGVWIFGHGSSAQPGVYERKMGVPVRYLKTIGTLIIVLALTMLVNGFPFRRFEYDQYNGDLGAVPYQHLIDYVNSKGAATFWAHPDAKNVDKVGSVNIETDEHSDLLLKTYGYTGFAVFYEGYENVGAPGRIWDVALKDYCRGIRPFPIWAIGALAFEKAGNLEEYMASLRMVFLLSNFSKAGVVDALKCGRMYVFKGKESANFVMDNFSVRDPGTGDEKTMGQTITVSDNPHLIIKGRFKNGKSKAVNIAIIKDGEIIKVMDVDTPFAIDFEDKDIAEKSKFYYRAEIKSEGLFVVTNPVFVTRR